MSVSTSPPGPTRPERVADGPGGRAIRISRSRPRMRRRRCYADRNLALINRTSLVSFGALLISQTRFVLLQPPCSHSRPARGVHRSVYYVISLFVNVGTRGFDLAAHRALVARVAAWLLSRPRRLLARLRGAARVLAQHVGSRRRAPAGATRAPSTAYVLDDGTSERVRRMAEDFGFDVSASGRIGLDEEGREPAATDSPGHPASSSSSSMPTSRPGPTCPPSCCRTSTPTRSLGIVQSPQYFRHRRAHVMDRTGRRRGAGAVLPAGAGLQGPARRRDLRRLLRDLPPRGAGGQRRHDADRALRGRAHRLRPAPSRLGPAVHPDPAGDRRCARPIRIPFSPSSTGGAPDPCRCSAPGSSGPRACACGPASATSLDSAITCTRRCSRSPPRSSRW